MNEQYRPETGLEVVNMQKALVVPPLTDKILSEKIRWALKS